MGQDRDSICHWGDRVKSVEWSIVELRFKSTRGLRGSCPGSSLIKLDSGDKWKRVQVWQEKREAAEVEIV